MINLFIHDLSIETLVETPDNQGGFIKSHSFLQSFKGRIRPASAKEIEIGAKKEVVITNIGYIPSTIVIKNEDKVLFNNGEKVFKVISVRTPSLLNHHLEIELEEVIGRDN